MQRQLQRFSGFIVPEKKRELNMKGEIENVYLLNLPFPLFKIPSHSGANENIKQEISFVYI
jgi:hypothetical protein